GLFQGAVVAEPAQRVVQLARQHTDLVEHLVLAILGSSGGNGRGGLGGNRVEQGLQLVTVAGSAARGRNGRRRGRRLTADGDAVKQGLQVGRVAGLVEFRWSGHDSFLAARPDY